MQQVYGTKPEDLLCAVSPTIMECCFEVGSEVSEKFEEVFEKHDNTVSYNYDKPHVNLVNALKAQLIKAGVKEENIVITSYSIHYTKLYERHAGQDRRSEK